MLSRNTLIGTSDILEELRRAHDAAEDHKAECAQQLRWLLRELRFANIQLPFPEQLRVEDLQRQLGAW